MTRTQQAARKLQWSMVHIRLNRSLSRRPKLAALVHANIVPKECCKWSRECNDFIWGLGQSGPVKRKVERESMKSSLRLLLERKAREIRIRKRDGGVGILVWRFSRRMRVTDSRRDDVATERLSRENVSRLRRVFEGSGNV